MDSKFSLAGHNAIITGGTRGIGLAIAEAFRAGNLGVMDYVKYRNVEADTSMRNAIAGPDNGGGESTIE